MRSPILFAAYAFFALAPRIAAAQDVDAGAPAQAPASGTPGANAPSAGSTGGAVAPAAVPVPAAPAAPVPVAPPLPPPPEAPPIRRAKPLRSSVGLLPTASDLGSEADIVSTADNVTETAIAESLKKWTFSLKGYIRAPMRIGIGPSTSGKSGELHSPPRLPGFSSGDWAYVGLAPNTSGSLYVSVANPVVSANVIFSSNTFTDAGFMDLDQIGGITQAYVTLKFPTALGSLGGLAWTVGAFSNRYGNAGPNQTSSGYYGTYLMGRTHVAGETLTADMDLTDDLELLLEHGVGAKLDILPYIGPTAPQPVFFPGQGHAPHGSNFLHHAHLGLAWNKAIQFGAHYLTSWTPNDRSAAPPGREAINARLTSMGVDLHLDDDTWGHGYLGYSRVTGHDLYPLDEALQVIHGGDGYNFKLEYFGNKGRVSNVTPTNDAGTVHSLLFQYILRLAPVFGEALPIHDVALAAYGMFNHSHTLATKSTDLPTFDNDRLKFGAEVEFAFFKWMSLGFRFDRAIPDLNNSSDAFSVLSPRAIIHTNWKSKEYIIVDYSHYLLGRAAYPSSPYSALVDCGPNKPCSDTDMIMVSAIMSL